MTIRGVYTDDALQRAKEQSIRSFAPEARSPVQSVRLAFSIPDSVAQTPEPAVPTQATGPKVTLLAPAGHPKVAEIMRYFQERGRPVELVETEFRHEPTLELNIPGAPQIPLPDGRRRLDGGTGDYIWQLMLNVQDAKPLVNTNAARAHAQGLLRAPLSELPARPGSERWYRFDAKLALPTAIDQTVGAGANLGEGFWRMVRGGPGGARQCAGGLVELPFTLPALPLAAVETGATVVSDALNRWRGKSSGFVGAIATITWFLAQLVLVPLRLATQLAAIPVRALSFLGGALGRVISGPEYIRTAMATEPVALLEGSGRVFDFERTNRRVALADPETWIAFYEKNAGAIYGAPAPIVSELKALRDRDRDAYRRLRRTLADQGIQCFYRFPSLALLQQVLRDRTPQAGDTRPLALVVAGPSDHNTAFQTLSTTLAQLAPGHRLVYVEPTSDLELADAIDTFGDQHPINHLTIAGHGDTWLTNLSARDKDILRGSLDLTDYPYLRPLAKRFAPKATVVIESCLTGQDDPKDISLIEMLHFAWPGVDLYAPEKSDRGGGYDTDKSGRVTGAHVVGGRVRHLGP